MEMSTCDPPEFFAGADDVFWVEGSANSSEAGADEPLYSIGDLAKKFDVSLRALRFYESRGLLSPSRQGRHRRYGRKDADRLTVVLKAKKLGFTLGEIHLKLSREKCLEQIALFERKLAEVEEALAELRWIYTSLSARMGEVKPAGDQTT
jgi:DNA-binding transcriptional MerR regulator